jgi:uncharacterized phage protein (TIGR02218 family)
MGVEPVGEQDREVSVGKALMPRKFLTGSMASYVGFVQSQSRALVAHLYQFTSLAGANDYFTDLDWDVQYNSITWKSAGLRIDGLRRKTAVGLSVDEQSVKIYALPTDTLFGANFIEAAEEGLLDGCLITRYRAVWAVNTGNLLTDSGQSPVAVFTMFTGYASAIEKGGATRIEMKVKSPLVKLEVNMPRNYYQPGCLWTLFDTGCTLDKTLFAVNGTVFTATIFQVLPVGGIAVPEGPDALANYAQGRILFTSGVNNGLLTLIDQNDATHLNLAYPLETAPSPGDTFTFYPGCSKSFNTCDVKFNNKANFRGFDKVPPIAISI